MVSENFDNAQPNSAQPAPSIRELSNRWNQLGREHCHQISQQIAALKADPDLDGDQFDWPSDPRDQATAEAVLNQVRQFNLDGNWQEARATFDPAHEPFIPLLDQFAQNLPCITILGPDEYLFRVGPAYKEEHVAMHIKDGVVTTRSDILAAAASPNHDHFLFVTRDGYWISSGLDEPPTVHLAWMDTIDPHTIDIAQLADDGKTIAVVLGDESSVWLGRATGNGGSWHRVHPSEEVLGEHQEQFEEDPDEDEDTSWSDSMMHCALSPDGRFIAYGSQCHGHFVDSILPDGTTKRWAEIGYHSEYPDDACFSNDSDYVAFNSCHFYHGATVASKLSNIEGAHTECYEESELVTAIDTSLRVYASTWIPGEVAGSPSGLFALAGAGYLNGPDVSGKQWFRQEFGSSASSIDFCPKTRRLALASYSGFIHIYDVDSPELADRVCGHNARKELYRWIIWKDQAPFRW